MLHLNTFIIGLRQLTSTNSTHAGIGVIFISNPKKCYSSKKKRLCFHMYGSPFYMRDKINSINAYAVTATYHACRIGVHCFLHHVPVMEFSE